MNDVLLIQLFLLRNRGHSSAQYSTVDISKLGIHSNIINIYTALQFRSFVAMRAMT